MPRLKKAGYAFIAVGLVFLLIHFVPKFFGTGSKLDRSAETQQGSRGALNPKTAQVVMPAALKGTPCPMLTEVGAICEGVGPEGTLLRRDPTADINLHGCVYPNFDEVDDQDRPLYTEVTYYLKGKKVPHRPGTTPEKSDSIRVVPRERLDQLLYSLAPNCGPA